MQTIRISRGRYKTCRIIPCNHSGIDVAHESSPLCDPPPPVFCGKNVTHGIKYEDPNGRKCKTWLIEGDVCDLLNGNGSVVHTVDTGPSANDPPC